MAKIEKKILLKIWFKFSRKLIRNLKKSFCHGVKQLFPFEMSPNTTIYEPVGLSCAWFLAVTLFLVWKSKISHEQNVKEFQFYIRMPNFMLLGSIIKIKYPKVVDPLKYLFSKWTIRKWMSKRIQGKKYMFIYIWSRWKDTPNKTLGRWMQFAAGPNFPFLCIQIWKYSFCIIVINFSPSSNLVVCI